MPRPKRKSTAAEAQPAKRARATEDSKAEPAATGQKRGRGRPRKYPASATPKPPPTGPKRGRGRPRKVPKEEPATPALPKEEKKSTGRPRGRPRKYPRSPPRSPEPNGTSDAAAESSVEEQPKESESADSKAGSDEEQEEEEGEDEEDEEDDRSYWLMKAEPESRFEKGVDVKFSIDDLQAAKEPEAWDGVRNAMARNNLRAMKKGDLAFFYHSNCKVPGIAGMMEIVREHSVDETAFDPAHPYYDEKSSREDPKWEVVHVEFRRKFKNLVSLNELKSHAKPGGPLEDLQTLKQSRLSVTSVTSKQWKFIMKLVEQGEQQDSDENSGQDTDGASSSE